MKFKGFKKSILVLSAVLIFTAAVFGALHYFSDPTIETLFQKPVHKIAEEIYKESPDIWKNHQRAVKKFQKKLSLEEAKKTPALQDQFFLIQFLGWRTELISKEDFLNTLFSEFQNAPNDGFAWRLLAQNFKEDELFLMKCLEPLRHGPPRTSRERRCERHLFKLSPAIFDGLLTKESSEANDFISLKIQKGFSLCQPLEKELFLNWLNHPSFKHEIRRTLSHPRFEFSKEILKLLKENGVQLPQRPERRKPRRPCSISLK